MDTASSTTACSVNLIEKIFAAAMLVACLVLLARLLLGSRRRTGFDAWVRRAWVGIGRRSRRPQAVESAHARAERLAKEAIARARQRAEGGAWDGNVYRPRSFNGKRKKKRDLH